jgi:hypothetical protein
MSVRLLILCLFLVPALASARADDGPFTVTALPASAGDAAVASVTSGRLDHEFTQFDFQEVRAATRPSG